MTQTVAIKPVNNQKGHFILIKRPFKFECVSLFFGRFLLSS